MGLANISTSLMGVWSDSEVTSGVTEWSRVRVRIDPAVCYLVVGLWHPGSAQAAKGGGVHSLKPYMSWVKNVARQFGFYLLGLSFD